MQYKLIVGLGNPGAEYENTYHNAGRMALEELAHVLQGEVDDGAPLEFRRYKDIYEYAKFSAAIFVRPLSYMNKSGEAIKEAAHNFHATPEEILVLHDDSDLALGSYKLTRGQNAAGHHGVESTIESLGTPEFARVRIGIRDRKKDEVKRQKASTFVLKPVSKKDKEILEEVFKKISKEIF